MLPEPDDYIETPPFTDDDLDSYYAYLAGVDLSGEDEATVEFIQRWKVTDLSSAEWAMRKLQKATAAVEEIDRHAEEQKRQIEAWKTRARRDPERRRSYFEALLGNWQRELREADESKKSTPLIAGTIRSSRVGGYVQVSEDKDNRALFLDWAKTWLPTAVRPKPEPVAKVVKETIVFRKVFLPISGWYNEELREVDGCLRPISLIAEDSPEYREVDHAVLQLADGGYLVVPGVVHLPETINVTVTPAKP